MYSTTIVVLRCVVDESVLETLKLGNLTLVPLSAMPLWVASLVDNPPRAGKADRKVLPLTIGRASMMLDFISYPASKGVPRHTKPMSLPILLCTEEEAW